jgi:hypothetical protein
MSPSPAATPFWESASHACYSAIAPAIEWFGLLSQTQRLLLPTSLIVVLLLWVKLCPPKARVRSTAVEDEALYTAAIARWLASSEAGKKQRAENRA